MIKNHLVRIPRFFLWYLFGLFLFALVAPLFTYFIYFVCIMLLPFFLLLLIPGTGSREYRQISYAGRLADLWEIIFKSIGILAALALLRAVTIMLYQHIPGALRLLDTPLIIVSDFLGISSLAVVDFYLGIVGVIVFFMIMLDDTFWRIAQHRNILSMVYSRARSAAVGLVKMQGTAIPLEKYREQPAILEHCRSTSSDEPDYELRYPFYLEDETGRVLIETEGARFATETGMYGEKAGFAQYTRFLPQDYIGTILLPRNKTKRGMGSYFYRLLPGDPIYVLGVAQGRVPDENSDAVVVIRPKTGVFGHRHHDVFYLTNGMDKHPEQYFYRGMLHSWILFLVSSAIIMWLVFNANVGRVDYETAYHYSQEDVLKDFYGNRALEEPLEQVEVQKPEVIPLNKRPLEERCLTLVIGYMCVPEMLERIHTQWSYGDVHTILINLEYLGAADVAVAELEKMIRESDDQGRVAFGKRQLEHYLHTGSFR